MQNNAIDIIHNPLEHLYELFNGLERAHGEYVLTGQTTESGKAKGKARTIREPVTLEHWRQHDGGEQGLGIVPIRDDGTCVFAALDIDRYDVDLKDLEQRCAALCFPFIVCRSKSGGAHLYVFFSEPITAKEVRAKLKDMAAALGHPGVEIFPKQNRLANQEDVGNWINLPYFDSERTTRYAILDGKAVSLARFIALARERAIDPEAFLALPVPIVGDEGESSGNNEIQEGARNNMLFKIGARLKNQGLQQGEIEAQLLLENTTNCNPPLPEREVKQIAKSVNRYPSGGQKYRTDTGNAERFVNLHGNSVCYVPEFKNWLCWDGGRWYLDNDGAIFRLAKYTARSIYASAAVQTDDKECRLLAQWAGTSEAKPRLEAMVALAAHEIPTHQSELDQHPFLLGVENGVVDLRTGVLREPRREDLITKRAHVTFDSDSQCPTWLDFLGRIFAGNQKLINFVQRATGYALTGSTGEQCLFILHGTGANGKSTFVETVHGLLGDYGQKTEMRTLLHRDSDTVRNDLARLRGARFVSAVEIGRGKRLNEELVKELTGGDTITARFLFKEYFEFRPEFKLFIAVNHKPEIRGTDEAIWRRVKLVPFNVYIPEKERDKSLPQKLRNELPGILNWALKGCLDWQRNGLQEPKEVADATNDYRREQDLLADFLEECCVRGKNKKGEEYFVTAAALYIAYTTWCEDNGEQAVTQRTFGSMLSERGLMSKTKRQNGRPRRCYIEIGIKGSA